MEYMPVGIFISLTRWKKEVISKLGDNPDSILCQYSTQYINTWLSHTWCVRDGRQF